MQDSTEFSITLAINLDDNNKGSFWHCLDGVLGQSIPFTKVCVVDSCIQLPEGYFSGFLKRASKILPQSPQYKRVARQFSTPKPAQNIGWQFVNERFTPSTPLFMWLQANHYLRPNFISVLKDAFESHRYTCCYQFDLLPISGQKYTCVNSFCVTSQVFNEIIFSDKYDGNNLAALINNLVTREDEWKLPSPWKDYAVLPLYVEELS